MHKRSGFTIYELMISVGILTLISAAAVVNLRTTRMKDELNTATRLVAADLRSLQSQALAGSNLSSCMDSTGKYAACELNTNYCASDPSDCQPKPPYAVGAFFRRSLNYFDMFADVDTSKNDWQYTDDTEIFNKRFFDKNGAPNVEIFQLITNAGNAASVDVAFQRQNGSMGLNGCYAPCASPVSLTIILRHKISLETRSIYLNSYTGRISLE
ncbi:MAG: hypothetical protein ABIB04_01795 [Patescibacteria group bacterium]